MKESKIFFLLFLIIIISCFYSCKKKIQDEDPYQALVNLDSLYGPYYIKEFIQHGMDNIFDLDKKKIALHRWEIAIDGAITANRPIPILDTIISKESALLVVDMQRAFLDEGASIEVPEGRNIVGNINLLANRIRANGGKVIFLRYIVDENVGLLKYFESQSYLSNNRLSPLTALQENNPQFELYPELIVYQSDIIMNKNRYSAVLGSSIVDTLKHHKIKNVIITGVTTDVCAGDTAEALMQMDFNIIMAWNGCAALDRFEHEIYLARIFGLYGDVMPIEEIIMRLK